ncbi:FHA domain-containing protein [Vandammella animalimorsus]|nr:FHA domain-containing protein [Vandammella animalimorsus]
MKRLSSALSPMAYKLIVTKEDRVMREHALVAPLTHIGRRQHNDLVLEDSTVSGKHAIVRINGAQLDIEDVGSTNGTYVNGDPIPAKVRQDLQLGDRIVIGPYRISVQLQMEGSWDTGQSITPTLTASHFEETQPASALVARSLPAAIDIATGANAGRRLMLNKIVTTIGSPAVGVLSFTHRPNHYTLTKLEGAQEAFVNDQPIGANKPIQLKDGDRIRMAAIEMVFRLLPPAA